MTEFVDPEPYIDMFGKRQLVKYPGSDRYKPRTAEQYLDDVNKED